MTGPEKTKLREFGKQDLGAVHELIMRTIEASYEGLYPPSAVTHFKEHHAREEILSDWRDGYTIVLVWKDRIVGTGVLLNGEVRRVYVDPVLQGRGLGKRIMHDLEQHALEAGHERVRLDSSIPARAFYDSLGYHLEEEKAAVMPDGEKLIYYDMTKHLKESTI
jgi:GNAT superfamily N-acetyltransferase